MTITGQDHADATGEIAFERQARARSKRSVRLHLLKTPGGWTVCGQFNFDRHRGDEHVHPDTPRCRKCFP